MWDFVSDKWLFFFLPLPKKHHLLSFLWVFAFVYLQVFLSFFLLPFFFTAFFFLLFSLSLILILIPLVSFFLLLHSFFLNFFQYYISLTIYFLLPPISLFPPFELKRSKGDWYCPAKDTQALPFTLKIISLYNFNFLNIIQINLKDISLFLLIDFFLQEWNKNKEIKTT